MLKRILVAGTILTTFIIGGCTEENPLISDDELVVVWAFLYAGQPVTDIKLTSTIPLDTDTTIAPTINGADVVLIKAGQRYECEPTPGDSGYYHYSGTDLQIETGDLFSIEIQHEDQLVTGQTVVPDAPTNVSTSSPVFYVPDFSDLDTFGDWKDSDSTEIVVSWDSENESWFFVTVDNIEENPAAIYPTEKGPSERKTYPPVNADQYSVGLTQITHLGLHQVNVYTVNSEYVELYEMREQNSRDLNEPATNITNGLGVFSAFNSGSAILDVVRLK